MILLIFISKQVSEKSFIHNVIRTNLLLSEGGAAGRKFVVYVWKCGTGVTLGSAHFGLTQHGSSGSAASVQPLGT